jgi:hypothetical protein
MNFSILAIRLGHKDGIDRPDEDLVSGLENFLIAQEIENQLAKISKSCPRHWWADSVRSLAKRTARREHPGD